MQIPFNEIFLYLKYAAAIVILAVIILAPAYLARQTKKDKYNMVKIRISSWLLGWSGLGWLWALWQASKK